MAKGSIFRLVIVATLSSILLVTVLVYMITGSPVIIYYVPHREPITIVSPSQTPFTKIKSTVFTELVGVEKSLEYVRSFLAVKVDKSTYTIGDSVKITVINEGNLTVKIADPPWAIYMRINGKGWVKVFEPPFKLEVVEVFDVKRGVMVNTTVPKTIILKPGSSYSWTWDLKVHGKYVKPGYYAVSLRRSNIYFVINEEPISINIVLGKLLCEDEELRKIPVAYFTVKY